MTTLHVNLKTNSSNWDKGKLLTDWNLCWGFLGICVPLDLLSFPVLLTTHGVRRIFLRESYIDRASKENLMDDLTQTKKEKLRRVRHSDTLDLWSWTVGFLAQSVPYLSLLLVYVKKSQTLPKRRFLDLRLPSCVINSEQKHK